jgi:hypothetical protein
MATTDATLRTRQIAEKGIYGVCVCGYVCTCKADKDEHMIEHYLSYSGNMEYLYNTMR